MAGCASPGKIMLAGEYAVLDGGPAVLMAIDRYAVARVGEGEQALSPFLAAARDVLRESFGAASAQAQAAASITVDTSSFLAGSEKLGLGSSAAATVAAMGAALSMGPDQLDPHRVHELARRAHGNAQATLGARGSGADVACCTYGGVLRFQERGDSATTTALALPAGLHLVFPWTGQPASTAPLVASVGEFRRGQATRYQALQANIAEGAQRLAEATTPGQAIEALRAAGDALAALGREAALPLWLPIHEKMAALAQEQGGVLKPTGAGGGDLAVAAFASQVQTQEFVAKLQALEIVCPTLAVARQGVRLLA